MDSAPLSWRELHEIRCPQAILRMLQVSDERRADAQYGIGIQVRRCVERSYNVVLDIPFQRRTARRLGIPRRSRTLTADYDMIRIPDVCVGLWYSSCVHPRGVLAGAAQYVAPNPHCGRWSERQGVAGEPVASERREVQTRRLPNFSE